MSRMKGILGSLAPEAGLQHFLGGPPHPVIVSIGDNKDYIRVL